MGFSPLTVLHISTEPGWQGGEQQAYYLAEGLRQRGHRSIIVARKDGAFAARMRDQYFDVHTFRRRGRGPDALWSLRRLVTTLRPHILHARIFLHATATRLTIQHNECSKSYTLPPDFHKKTRISDDPYSAKYTLQE